MPKPLFRGVCASSITPFHPDGIFQPLPESHRETLANMLVNLGYEVHTEGMG